MLQHFFSSSSLPSLANVCLLLLDLKGLVGCNGAMDGPHTENSMGWTTKRFQGGRLSDNLSKYQWHDRFHIHTRKNSFGKKSSE